VGPENFGWIVDAVAKMAVERALAPPSPPAMRWDGFLRGGNR